MPKTVVQSVSFKKTTPAALYAIYMNSKKHAAVTGSRYVKVENRVGGKFRAFTMLSGKILLLRKDKMILQTWRSKGWKKTDPDSILLLSFNKTKNGARLNLVHSGIPEHDYRAILKGWPKYYWNPMRRYLKRNEKNRR